MTEKKQPKHDTRQKHRKEQKPQEKKKGHLFQSHETAPRPAPNFADLFTKPLVKTSLPNDFDAAAEEKHLRDLWQSAEELQRYEIADFVHAGGSGMVFRVIDARTNNQLALKIVRQKLFALNTGDTKIATSLSPVSENELRALEKVAHPNLVRFYDAIGNPKIFALCTSYVESPRPIDDFLAETLQRDPAPATKGSLQAFSPHRLEKACRFLIEKCQEVASAIQHLHKQCIFHFDVKPNNILISADNRAILTDMGACVHTDKIDFEKPVRVHFTWTYAHSDLTSISNDPASISGGGLKASAQLPNAKDLAKFDLFAFGKTILEALAVLEHEFGERCHSSYGFRALHLIACLLLDGKNAVGSGVFKRDGRRFMSDTALDYPTEIFAMHRIRSADELVRRLNRLRPEYSWNEMASELRSWQPDIINSVVNAPAPFTQRVASLLNHPCMRRLKNEHQLGWMREVFPGASHDRWSHTLGVFSALVSYYNSLLSDPEVPTLRLLVNREDVSHAFLAAIVHDLGQTAFGHDFEEVCPFLFSHETIRARLLAEPLWGSPTLKETIVEHWPDTSFDRVFSILNHSFPPRPENFRPIDGVAADAINGPIDADKLDYLQRDSVACGVPYGGGIDVQRFIRELTVTTLRQAGGLPRFALAYKAKGRAAVTSVLLARYQMWGAVYWHHTFRCIQAMFGYAASSAFPEEHGGVIKLSERSVATETMRNLLYYRVVCGLSWGQCIPLANANDVSSLISSAPPLVDAEPALDFVWQFASQPIRHLLEQLSNRALFKRVFELRLGELGDRADYSAMKADLSPRSRVSKAKELQALLLEEVLNVMRERGSRESATEDAAKRRLDEIKDSLVPLVILDFPVRGISRESNTPKELGDAIRKYFVVTHGGGAPADNIFFTARKLQEHMATIRVFAAPDFHEMIIRYLQPAQIEACVAKVVELARRNS